MRPSFAPPPFFPSFVLEIDVFKEYKVRCFGPNCFRLTFFFTPLSSLTVVYVVYVVYTPVSNLQTRK